MKGARIAVLSPVDFEHANAMLSGVKDVARQQHWDVLPLHYSQDIALRDLVARQRVQGVIGDLLSDRWVQSLCAPRSVTLVHTGDQSALHAVSSVRNDDSLTGRLAAGHFLSRQYQHLYYAALGADDVSSRDRHAGFSAAAMEAGRKAGCLPPICLTAPLDAWTKLIQRIPSPAAVFCKDDTTARRILACCRQLNRSVPETLSLIGVGNSSLDSFFAGIGISSISPDHATLGAEAARLLARAMGAPDAPAMHIRIPPAGLVLKDTTGTGTMNALVGRAVDFMERQLEQPISVADTARHVNASRRLLELRFREALDRSPHEELIRLRMARARVLLADARVPIATVAEQCGYPERSHFYARFKQHHDGATPAAWRRAAQQASAS